MNATLAKQIESFISAPTPADRQDAFRQLLSGIKDTLRQDDYPSAAQAIRAAADPALDFTSAQSLYRLMQRVKGKDPAPAARCRIAVLGSFTADQITQLLDLFLFAAGVSAEIYAAEYGSFCQEILDERSELYRFKPQFIFLATTHRDLAHVPPVSATRQQVRDAVDREFADWQTLWETAYGRLSCQVIQNNFDTPPWRALDNHELRHPAGLGGYIARVNLAFADRAPSYVILHDVDHLSATTGRVAWGDQRFFHLAKIPCAPECQVDYAHSVASLIAAQLGAAKKCLVLDLDNTLWGGVIGDDGLGGIRLGQGGAEGEAFVEFQRYAQTLRRRGVILAVCSKNDEANAREPFEKHPEMVLKLEDISCFVANWTDKAANLKSIAKQLNIGLNSLVFIDDNPAERSVVRQLAPEVAVPEIPADPAGYVRALERHRYFQIVSLGAEDLQRTDMYRANTERESLQASASGDLKQFLRSLAMTGRIEPINPVSLERSVQLVNKSNQFNLTTRRYSTAEVLARTADPTWVTRTVTLADRFGDNGLISVLMARETDGALLIDTWLMSCRVLRRGVEQHLLNHVVGVARQRGLAKIRGEYIPTAKNGMVADHYSSLGFRQTASDPDGRTSWELDFTADWQPFETFIQETN